MVKSSRYLFIVVFVGIFFISVSAVGAAYDSYMKKSGTAADQQSTGVGQKGDEAGIIVIDSVITDRKTLEQPKLQPGTTLKPGGSDTLQRKNVPRGQRGLGGVIPPDFEDKDR